MGNAAVIADIAIRTDKNLENLGQGQIRKSREAIKCFQGLFRKAFFFSRSKEENHFMSLLSNLFGEQKEVFSRPAFLKTPAARMNQDNRPVGIDSNLADLLTSGGKIARMGFYQLRGGLPLIEGNLVFSSDFLKIKTPDRSVIRLLVQWKNKNLGRLAAMYGKQQILLKIWIFTAKKTDNLLVSGKIMKQGVMLFQFKRGRLLKKSVNGDSIKRADSVNSRAAGVKLEVFRAAEPIDLLYSEPLFHKGSGWKCQQTVADGTWVQNQPFSIRMFAEHDIPLFIHCLFNPAAAGNLKRIFAGKIKDRRLTGCDGRNRLIKNYFR